MYDLVSDDITAKTWVLLNQAADAAYRATSKRLRAVGVSFEQARVLFILGASSSSPTRTELSRILMRKPHTVTDLLNGMQRAGLIRRIKDEGNHKLVRVVLTKKGREMRKQVSLAPMPIELTSFLSSRELHQLSSMLEKVRNVALEQLETGPP
jgi:DNA-binding MarR family transcriptional regulator